jgi:hypothetical protein
MIVATWQLFSRAARFNARARQSICDSHCGFATQADGCAQALRNLIKVEMEDICDWPTELMNSVQPDGDSWIAVVTQEGPAEDAGPRQMIEQLAARLKAEFDLNG